MENFENYNKYYLGKYDNLARFISYYQQIDIVRKINPDNILEIGVGNKTVSNYLRQNGYKIDTCDYDKNLSPDFVADIRRLPFKNESYDTVIACEIIEHIPWEDAKLALSEIYRVTRKYVIISIPYSSLYFELILKLPFKLRFKKHPHIITTNDPMFDLFFRIPLFFSNYKFTKEHFWEMGTKNFSRKKIKKIFKINFDIINEIRPILNGYHHFFILKKK